MGLPIQQTGPIVLPRDFSLLQTTWAAQINPVLAQPLNSGVILRSVPLLMGSNVINHLLGRMLQGWFLVDVDAAVTVYRSAPKNALTLTLTSSAAATADLFIF